MKKSLLVSMVFIAITAFTVLTGATSCKKEIGLVKFTDKVTDTITITNCVSNIQGLWEGTFTTVSGYATTGTSYFFSLSLYKDGTCSYKSGTGSTSVIIYAAGTYSLVGNNLTFTCKTINGPVVDVIGNATYNKIAATLTNGSTSTISPISAATWKMEKVN